MILPLRLIWNDNLVQGLFVFAILRYLLSKKTLGNSRFCQTSLQKWPRILFNLFKKKGFLPPINGWLFERAKTIENNTTTARVSIIVSSTNQLYQLRKKALSLSFVLEQFEEHFPDSESNKIVMLERFHHYNNVGMFVLTSSKSVKISNFSTPTKLGSAILH